MKIKTILKIVGLGTILFFLGGCDKASAFGKVNERFKTVHLIGVNNERKLVVLGVDGKPAERCSPIKQRGSAYDKRKSSGNMDSTRECEVEIRVVNGKPQLFDSNGNKIEDVTVTPVTIYTWPGSSCGTVTSGGKQYPKACAPW